MLQKIIENVLNGIDKVGWELKYKIKTQPNQLEPWEIFKKKKKKTLLSYMPLSLKSYLCTYINLTLYFFNKEKEVIVYAI